ncbi:MAG: cation:proton antiporter [Chloroflexota bacterium]
MGIAADIIVIVLGSLVLALLLARVGQPPLIGYILAGVLLGPNAFGFITNVEEIELLSEIGVSLLMFSLGLQLQLKDLQPVRRIALYGTLVQMTLTILFGVLIGAVLGWRLIEGVWFGALISLSSTVVILKLFQERGLLGTLSSKVIIGIMIVQDLAVVPLMLLLPALEDPTSGLASLGWAVVRAALLLVGMVFAGTRVMPMLLRSIARGNSRELFLIGVTALGLGVGYLTYLMGLSFAFGAFVAGIVLGESEYSLQALGDIIPLRDLFSLLFFASVGMLLDPRFLLDNVLMVLTLVIVVSVGKMAILAGVTRAFGYANVIPIAVALLMFQVGEFSFVLAGIGLETGVLDSDFFGILLSVAIVTIILTPPLSALITPLYNIQRRVVGDQILDTVANFPKEGFNNHVIIAGGGHIGRYVARSLQKMDMQFIVIDLNPEQVEGLKAEGMPVIFGDATHPVVLEAAQFRNACLLVDTVPDITSSSTILSHIRNSGIDLRVVARVETEEEKDALASYGVYRSVMPQLEAGVEMVRQALIHMEIPQERVTMEIPQVRMDIYDYEHMG